MKLTYCDKWSFTKKRPWNLIDSVKAQENHINKVPYTVMIQEEDDDGVKYVIEITDKYVLVNFMNEFNSPYLCYDFNVIDGNNIFLAAAYHTSYDSKNNEESVFMSFSFETNGNIIMERKDCKTGEIEERELKKDASSNWDKFPEFGKYDHLLIEAR